jgi:transcriptional regulator with XRE-family HTH domain
MLETGKTWAETAHVLGCSTAAMSQWKTGKTSPSRRTLHRLTQAEVEAGLRPAVVMPEEALGGLASLREPSSELRKTSSELRKPAPAAAGVRDPESADGAGAQDPSMRRDVLELRRESAALTRQVAAMQEQLRALIAEVKKLTGER